MTLLKLPYVKTYRDRHGRVRRYFHRRGSPDVALPGAVGSPEFLVAYQAASGTPSKPPNPHAAGTLAKLITDYYRSAEFVNLKPASQRLYRICLDPIAKRDGHRLVRDMPRDKISQDYRGNRRHSARHGQRHRQGAAAIAQLCGR